MSFKIDMLLNHLDLSQIMLRMKYTGSMRSTSSLQSVSMAFRLYLAKLVIRRNLIRSFTLLHAVYTSLAFYKGTVFLLL